MNIIPECSYETKKGEENKKRKTKEKGNRIKPKEDFSRREGEREARQELEERLSEEGLCLDLQYMAEGERERERGKEKQEK